MCFEKKPVLQSDQTVANTSTRISLVPDSPGDKYFEELLETKHIIKRNTQTTPEGCSVGKRCTILNKSIEQYQTIPFLRLLI